MGLREAITSGFGFRSRPRASATTVARPVRRQVSGKYDAAQTTTENARHWAAADDLGANSANSADVRRILRKRARYETGNNCYAKGIILTLVNDLIGTGPRLQLRAATGADSANIMQVERAFGEWAAQVNLAAKLRTMLHAKKQDGESFAILFGNRATSFPVQLDLNVIEAEQVATPTINMSNLLVVDGLELDQYGRPNLYHVLKQHPGELGAYLGAEYDKYPASAVIHLFRQDRPGQYRGIPEITPALPLFAFLRRFTLAVVSAAETAADYAGVIETAIDPGGEAPAVTPMDVVELERGMLTTLQEGGKLAQVKAEQPTTTYPQFKAELINEIARCLNIPYNIAACNSSAYNYASGRMDHQTYFRSIQIEQADIAATCLNRLFWAWYAEASRIPGYLPRLRADFSVAWMWDGREHVDPAKEANAQETRLANGTTNLAREWSRLGEDWELQEAQRLREKFTTIKIARAIAQEMGFSQEDADRIANPAPRPANPAQKAADNADDAPPAKPAGE